MCKTAGDVSGVIILGVGVPGWVSFSVWVADVAVRRLRVIPLESFFPKATLIYFQTTNSSYTPNREPPSAVLTLSLMCCCLSWFRNLLARHTLQNSYLLFHIDNYDLLYLQMCYFFQFFLYFILLFI